jgi:hypothetical protein
VRKGRDEERKRGRVYAGCVREERKRGREEACAKEERQSGSVY